MNKKMALSFVFGFLLVGFTGCGGSDNGKNNSSTSKGVFSSFKEDYSKITPVALQEYEAAKFDSMKKEIFNPSGEVNPSRKTFPKKDLRMFALNYIDNVAKPGTSNYNGANIQFINFFEDGDTEIIKREFLQYAPFETEFINFLSKVYEKEKDGKLNKTYEKTRKIIEENIFELVSLNKNKKNTLETYFTFINSKHIEVNFDPKTIVSNIVPENCFLITILKEDQIKSNTKELFLAIFKNNFKLTTPTYNDLRRIKEFQMLFDNVKNVSFTDKEIENSLAKNFIPESKFLENKSFNEYYNKNKEKLDLEAKNEIRENIIKAIENFKINKGNIVRVVPKEYFDDKDLMEFLIKSKNFLPVLSFVSERLKDDKEFVLKALKMNTIEYEYISDNLKKDPTIIYKLIEESKLNKNLNVNYISRFIIKDLRNDKDFVITMLKNKIFQSESFPKEMYKNNDVLYYMLYQYGSDNVSDRYLLLDKWNKYAPDEIKSKYKTPVDFLIQFQI